MSLPRQRELAATLQHARALPGELRQDSHARDLHANVHCALHLLALVDHLPTAQADTLAGEQNWGPWPASSPTLAIVQLVGPSQHLQPTIGDFHDSPSLGVSAGLPFSVTPAASVAPDSSSPSASTTSKSATCCVVQPNSRCHDLSLLSLLVTFLTFSTDHVEGTPIAK